MSSLQDMSGLLFIEMTGPNAGKRLFNVLHKTKIVLGLFCLQLNTIS